MMPEVTVCANSDLITWFHSGPVLLSVGLPSSTYPLGSTILARSELPRLNTLYSSITASLWSSPGPPSFERPVACLPDVVPRTNDNDLTVNYIPLHVLYAMPFVLFTSLSRRKTKKIYQIVTQKCFTFDGPPPRYSSLRRWMILDTNAVLPQLKWCQGHYQPAVSISATLAKLL